MMGLVITMVIIAVLLVALMYACVVIGSRADKMEERWRREHKKE